MNFFKNFFRFKKKKSKFIFIWNGGEHFHDSEKVIRSYAYYLSVQDISFRIPSATITSLDAKNWNVGFLWEPQKSYTYKGSLEKCQNFVVNKMVDFFKECAKQVSLLSKYRY